MLVSGGQRQMVIGQPDGGSELNVNAADRVDEMLEPRKIGFDVIVDGASAKIANRLDRRFGAGVSAFAARFRHRVGVVDFGQADARQADPGVPRDRQQMDGTVFRIDVNQHQHIGPGGFCGSRIRRQQQDAEAAGRFFNGPFVLGVSFVAAKAAGFRAAICAGTAGVWICAFVRFRFRDGRRRSQHRDIGAAKMPGRLEFQVQP